MIINIIGISLITFSTTAMITRMFYKSTNKKSPIIQMDMEEILKNNNYTPLEEWRKENANN